MAQWSPFPYLGHYQFNTSTLPKQWERLHAGDAEPLHRREGPVHRGLVERPEPVEGSYGWQQGFDKLSPNG